MSPEQFKAWRKAMGFKSQSAVAEALGVSKGTIELYETGRRRDNGLPVTIPDSIILACAAVQLAVQRGKLSVDNPKALREWAYDLIEHVGSPG